MRCIRQSLKSFIKIGSNLKLDMKCKVSVTVQNCCRNFIKLCEQLFLIIWVSWEIIIPGVNPWVRSLASIYTENWFALSIVWYVIYGYLHLVRCTMAKGQNCFFNVFHLKRLGFAPLNKCKDKRVNCIELSLNWDAWKESNPLCF